MVPKLSILIKAAAAIVMMAALFFLTTANFWVYGLQKQKQAINTVSVPAEEEPDADNTAVPNPVEEKSSNTLQNLSEYLHDGQHILSHPVITFSFGSTQGFLKLPVHHPELLTPPPKPLA